MVIIKNFKKSSKTFTLCSLILGILLVFQSETTLVTISYIIGGMLMLVGISAFLKKEKGNKEMSYIYGVIAIILGILVVINPKAIASIVPFVIGILILINGAAKLQLAMTLRALGHNLWKSTMIVAVVSALFGVILLLNPFSGAVNMVRVIGIIVIVFSIIDLLTSHKVNKVMPKDKTVESSNIIEVEARVKKKR